MPLWSFMWCLRACLVFMPAAGKAFLQHGRDLNIYCNYVHCGKKVECRGVWCNGEKLTFAAFCAQKVSDVVVHPEVLLQHVFPCEWLATLVAAVALHTWTIIQTHKIKKIIFLVQLQIQCVMALIRSFVHCDTWSGGSRSLSTETHLCGWSCVSPGFRYCWRFCHKFHMDGCTSRTDENVWHMLHTMCPVSFFVISTYLSVSKHTSVKCPTFSIQPPLTSLSPYFSSISGVIGQSYTNTIGKILLLHRGVGQLLSVNDQVSVVRGFQCEASVTDAAAVASLLVLLHDVLQVLFPLCKRQLETEAGSSCVIISEKQTRVHLLYVYSQLYALGSYTLYIFQHSWAALNIKITGTKD